MSKTTRTGFYFTKYEAPNLSPFDRLFDVFKELIVHTSGDFDEAISWLRELDKEYELTTKDYTIEDFIEDLKNKGYIREELDDDGKGAPVITAKTERLIRQKALEQIFGNIKKSASGDHKSKHRGNGDEHTGELREFRFGDGIEKISLTESLKNAQINNGMGDFQLTERDLVVEETQFKAQMSTVLMIDISHSMILYGEDRITPAKKVAMALSELITTRYPKDSLDILVFGNDAWAIKIADLPYLKVGPYHTNTVAGLQLAMDMCVLPVITLSFSSRCFRTLCAMLTIRSSSRQKSIATMFCGASPMGLIGTRLTCWVVPGGQNGCCGAWYMAMQCW